MPRESRDLPMKRMTITIFKPLIKLSITEENTARQFVQSWNAGDWHGIVIFGGIIIYDCFEELCRRNELISSRNIKKNTKSLEKAGVITREESHLIAAYMEAYKAAKEKSLNVEKLTLRKIELDILSHFINTVVGELDKGTTVELIEEPKTEWQKADNLYNQGSYGQFLVIAFRIFENSIRDVYSEVFEEEVSRMNSALRKLVKGGYINELYSNLSWVWNFRNEFYHQEGVEPTQDEVDRVHGIVKGLDNLYS